jgi:hypothetical protein
VAVVGVGVFGFLGMVFLLVNSSCRGGQRHLTFKEIAGQARNDGHLFIECIVGR